MKVQVAEKRTFESFVEHESSNHSAAKKTITFTFYKKLMDSAGSLVKPEREIKVVVSDDAVVVTVADERVIRSRMRQGEAPAEPLTTSHDVKGEYSEILAMPTLEQVKYVMEAYVIPLYQ